jgi:hypothetical protein
MKIVRALFGRTVQDVIIERREEGTFTIKFDDNTELEIYLIGNNCYNEVHVRKENRLIASLNFGGEIDDV